MNIEQYNLVDQTTAVTPNYDISRKELYIELYFDSQDTVIIVGAIDSNYISWASVSSTNDIKLNAEIFNRIAKGGFRCATNEYLALKKKGIRYEDLKRYYKAVLLRTQESGGKWKTPFGHYYSLDRTESNGDFFANDVKGFPEVLRERCRIRECNGQYAALLREYTAELRQTDFRAYDFRIRPIREMLEQEGYLVLSRNEDIKRLYLECIEITREKYNEYMTAIR